MVIREYKPLDCEVLAELFYKTFEEHYGLVAIDDEMIATAICNQLEQAVQGSIVTHASITARLFLIREVTEL